MCSFPVSLVLGILGIFLDRRRWLAIVTTVISGGCIVLIASMIVVSIVMNA